MLPPVWVSGDKQYGSLGDIENRTPRLFGEVMAEDGKGSTAMRLPDEVTIFLAMNEQGIGSKSIAKAPGVARNSIPRYLRADGWVASRASSRTGSLSGRGEWLRTEMQKHGNNPEAVRPHHTLVRAEALATVRFEAGHGEQSQIDFGEHFVVIAGERIKVYFFVPILALSRWIKVRTFTDERRDSWFADMESAFMHFGR